MDSEAQWRMYSGFRDYDAVPKRIHKESALVVSSVEELAETLQPPSGWTVFIGRVKYLPREHLAQLFANEVGARLGQAFSGDEGHARSLLFKRHHFEFEQEIRVLAVPASRVALYDDLLAIPMAKTDWIREIILDPRLVGWKAAKKAESLMRRRFARQARQTELRERHLYQIQVHIPSELADRVRKSGPEILY
ncbi:MAG TPA: hypothetical protein VJ935_03895 [Acidimicrobiia bacterium]|nr:hypothetical protein [Acidimicrobiia bacterium]